MKKYIYWIFVAFVAGLGIYFVAISAQQPQSVAKLKFTTVDRPEKFGELVYQTLGEELKKKPILFLGVTPNQVEDLELWKGFLSANQEPASKYDLVIMETQLSFSDVLTPPVRLDLKEEHDRLIEGIKNARAKNLRVAIVGPSIYTSQIIPQNLSSILRNDDNLEITSLTVVKYPVTIEQENEFDPRCSVDKEDRVGTGPLGCVIMNKARNLYRKKAEPGKYSGIMDQLSEHDFLILFNRN